MRRESRPPKGPTLRDVEKRIKGLLEKGAIWVRPHTKKRMAERKIVQSDLLHAIRLGCVVEEQPAVCPDKAQRYKLRGRSVEGAQLDVIVEVTETLLEIRTVFRP